MMIRPTLLIAFFCGMLSVNAQTDLYGPDIQKIEIYFTQSNWDYQLDTAKAGSEGYIVAEWVKVNGVQFDSVGVKYKGNSSYNANNNKNPLHIELDYTHNTTYNGISDIKLGNGFSDPSMFREVLSYEILRNYMHAPKCNFAQVYINGSLRGLYSNAESINKDFVGTHFYSFGNTLVKCNPQTVGGGNLPNLSYLGTDSTLYYSKYEIKSDFGWTDLIRLCDSLNNNFSNIEKIMDIDRAIWMLAFNNVLVNLDSYTGSFAQNYYEYLDDNGRFNSIIWDLNMCFGGFNMTGIGAPLSVTQEQNMSPTLHSTSTNRPLIKNILSDARYKRMYIAHMKTITNEFFTNGAYVTMAQDYMTLIDTAVQSDPYKFFTYTQFQNSLTTSVTSGPMTIPGISLLMNARATYLNSTTEFQQVSPVLSNINYAPASPTLNDTVWITAQISNQVYSYLGYRYHESEIFNKTQMMDDGLHHDGAAGDGVFGAYFICGSAQMQYYIYTENNNAGLFSPARAEYEFYTIDAAVSNLNSGDLVINEYMAQNTATVANANGKFGDWVELYNNSTSTLSLFGLYLTDDATNPTKWAFPSATTIAPSSFLIVWCDQDTSSLEYHANFKLSASGESIYLNKADGTVLDSSVFSAQTADISMQRCPNGTGLFSATLGSTFNSLNCVVGVEENVGSSFSIYPNPASDRMVISSASAFKQVEVFNATGQIENSWSGSLTGNVSMDLSALSNGIYFIRIDGSFAGKVVIQK